MGEGVSVVDGDVVGAREVTRLWEHEDTLVKLDLDDGLVTTTEDHPFWNHTDNEWQRADMLDVGDELPTADGDLVTIQGPVDDTEVLDTAYNLTVEDLHTYYVATGDNQVLVHNTCGVINETLAARGGIRSRYTLSADDTLTAGERWLGPGYRELGRSGSGVYRSADDLRQFRIDPSSLAGAHYPGVPHVHFELFTSGNRRLVNNHVPFL